MRNPSRLVSRKSLFQIVGGSKGHGVNEGVNLTVVLLADLLKDSGDLLVLGDVALESLRAGQAADHLFGILPKALVLICDCDLRALGVQFLGDGPGDTALVGQTENNGHAPLQAICHLCAPRM